MAITSANNMDNSETIPDVFTFDEATPFAVVVLEYENGYKVKSASESVFGLCGYGKSALEQMPYLFAAILARENQGTEFGRALENGSVQDGEYTTGWIMSDGTKKSFNTIWKTRIGFEYNHTYVYVYISDVTAIISQTRESQNQLETLKDITEGIEDIVMAVNYDATIRYLSPSITRRFGYDANEPIGRSVFEYISDEDIPRAVHAYNRAFDNPGTVINADSYFRHKEGHYIPVSGLGKAVWNAYGEKFVVVVGRELNEMPSDQLMLKNNEERLRGIFAESPIAIGFFDKNGKIIDVNKAFLRLFGISGLSVIKDKLIWKSKGLSPEAVDKLQSGSPIRMELLYSFDEVIRCGVYPTSRSGSIYLDARITPLLRVTEGADNQIYIIQILDITDRVRAEKSLRESEEIYRTLAESAQDLIFIIDRHGVFEYVNGFLCNLVGLAPSDLTGKSHMAVSYDFFSEANRLLFARVFKDNVSVNFEHEIRSNEAYWYDTLVVPLRREEGKVISALCISRNITDRKKMEESRNDFLNSVTHELRTPLATIIGYAENMMADTSLSEKSREMIGIIRDHAKNETAIVNELIAIASMYKGENHYDMQEYNGYDFFEEIKPILENACENAVAATRGKCLREFTVTISEALKEKTVYCDGQVLRKVFSDLVTKLVSLANTMEIRASITFEAEGDSLTTSIWSSGKRLSKSTMDLAFQPFLTETDSAGYRQPLGEGLYLARKHILMHGGEIEFDRDRQEGCMLKLIMPFRRKLSTSASRSGLSRTVVVVDDNQDMLSLMKDIFELDNITVYTAASCKEFRAIILNMTNRPDVVFMDIQLPDGNGADLVSQMKSEGVFLPRRLYLFSARASHELNSIALRIGADGYFTKPFDIGDFLKAVMDI